jgi:hypothetical protein
MVALLLVAGCAFAIYRLRLRSKLNARIEAVRAAGYPVNGAELNEWYSIPDGVENAAYTIEGAFSYFVEAQDNKVLPKANALPRTESFDDQTRAVLTQYVIDNKEALELLHAGAAIEDSRYPVDFENAPESMFHHLYRLRRGATRLIAEAMIHADEKPHVSVRSVFSIFGLARSLEKEPALVSHLVRIALQACAVSSLEHVINRVDFTDEQLCELSRAVVDSQSRPALSRALVGERCMTLETLKRRPAELSHLYSPGLDARDSPIEANLTALAFALHGFTGLTDRSTIIYLDLMADYIEAAQLPFDERREEFEAIDARCRELWRKDFVLRHLVDAITLSNKRSLICIAHLRTARAAVATQRYRLANDRPPDTLGDLVPDYLDAVPIDPFDGEQLRYKKLEVGFVVYSIGEDQDDDGGKERFPAGQKKRRPYECDITFIVER